MMILTGRETSSQQAVLALALLRTTPMEPGQVCQLFLDFYHPVNCTGSPRDETRTGTLNITAVYSSSTSQLVAIWFPFCCFFPAFFLLFFLVFFFLFCVQSHIMKKVLSWKEQIMCRNSFTMTKSNWRVIVLFLKVVKVFVPWPRVTVQWTRTMTKNNCTISKTNKSICTMTKCNCTMNQQCDQE